MCSPANSKFVSEKGGMISITVKDGDPHRAAEIANAYVDELHDINSRLVIGEAAREKNFFLQQLAHEKDRLTDAEIALKQTEEATGAIAPTGQTGWSFRRWRSCRRRSSRVKCSWTPYVRHRRSKIPM